MVDRSFSFFIKAQSSFFCEINVLEYYERFKNFLNEKLGKQLKQQGTEIYHVKAKHMLLIVYGHLYNPKDRLILMNHQTNLVCLEMERYTLAYAILFIALGCLGYFSALVSHQAAIVNTKKKGK